MKETQKCILTINSQFALFFNRMGCLCSPLCIKQYILAQHQFLAMGLPHKDSEPFSIATIHKSGTPALKALTEILARQPCRSTFGKSLPTIRWCPFFPTSLTQIIIINLCWQWFGRQTTPPNCLKCAISQKCPDCM